MGFVRKIWKARFGVGLNKMSINGATPVPFDNVPDGLYEEGDYISQENLNDLEQRIKTESDEIGALVADEIEARTQADTALKNALQSLFIVRGLNTETTTSRYYTQVDCSYAGYTPIGIVGHYLSSEAGYFFRGRRIYWSGGTPYARIYWWNNGNQSWAGTVDVLYRKNDLV